MHLIDLAETYCLARDLAPASQERLFITARKFAAWKPSATIADLQPDIVNRWLAYLLDSGLGRRTIRGHRTNLLCLWAEAYPKLTTTPPLGVRKIKVPARPPEALWPHEVQRLVDAARTLPGRFRKTKLSRALYWESFVRFSFNTALRLDDTLSLERHMIWPDGSLVIVQRKTGQEHRVQLLPSTLEAIDRSMADQPNRRRIWPLWGTRWSFYQHYRRLAAAADVRGTSKWLRRSSATALERMHPGAAMSHLGHKTPGLAYRHYVDPRMLQFNRPLPPELD